MHIEAQRAGSSAHLPSAVEVVELRTCTKCGVEKALGEFYARKDGRRFTQCRSCLSISARARRLLNPGRSRETFKRWAAANPDWERQRKAEHYKANAPEINARSSIRRADPLVRAKDNRRAAARRAVPQNRINDSIRSRVNSSVKRGDKRWRRSADVIGYSMAELRSHLESQFRHGMKWSNYGDGGWEIDHIRPLSSFAFDTISDPQFVEAWALSNLQPLWSDENQSKGDRLDWSLEEYLATKAAREFQTATNARHVAGEPRAY